jgi:hypothetical protein
MLTLYISLSLYIYIYIFVYSLKYDSRPLSVNVTRDPAIAVCLYTLLVAHHFSHTPSHPIAFNTASYGYQPAAIITVMYINLYYYTRRYLAHIIWGIPMDTTGHAIL